MARTCPRLLAAVAATAIALPLHAQAIDYAKLQDVFGEPVTTSVTGMPERASDAPASIIIITRAEIETSPARSVPDLLKSFAGVDVNRWTAGQSDVAVRGGVQTYNARLLVLVNGRQVYLDHYGMTDWNLLGVELDEIQQIELVRGPASALFGFNAASGVVNIITADPLAGPHVAATAEGGTHGYARISGAVALPLAANVGLTLSGGHQEEDERAIPEALYRPARIDRVLADDVAARLGIAPGTQTRIELSGGWSRNRQLEFLPSQLLTEQVFRSSNVGLVVNRDTDWGSVTARAYTNGLHTTYGLTTGADDPFGTVNSIRYRNRITVGQASTLVRLSEASTLRLAAEYRNNQLYSADAFAWRIGYSNVAASSMLDVRPSDRVSLSIATRLDRLELSESGPVPQPAANSGADYDRTIAEASFNAALLLRVGEQGQLRLNGGRGIQAPSLIDFGTRVAVNNPLSPLPVFITGNPAIRPVVTWSAEAGYEQRLGSALRLGGTLFFTRTQDLIASPGDGALFGVVATTQPILVARFANVGRFDSAGVEATAAGDLGKRMSWRASYTWMRVRQELPRDGQTFAYALSPRDTTPAHAATLGLRYARGRWFTTLDARYTSATRQFAFDRTTRLLLLPVPGAVTLDGKIGVRVSRHLTAYLAGENLGDARGAYGSPIPADRRLRIGASVGL